MKKKFLSILLSFTLFSMPIFSYPTYAEEENTEVKKEESEPKSTEAPKEAPKEEKPKETPKEEKINETPKEEKTESSKESTTESSESSTKERKSKEVTSTESTSKKTEKSEKTEKKRKKTKHTQKEKEQRTIHQKETVDINNKKADDINEDEDGKEHGIIEERIDNDGSYMMDNIEYVAGFVYFCQGDDAWRNNGYHIASAGCGPTSMAVCISSLTDDFVTPVETTKWAYEHGLYSSAGSQHSLIPLISKAYDLKCEPVGRDKEKIIDALHKGHPVVALMGPGYFTHGGHFMVLVKIDDKENVTVADVGSRRRTQYTYQLDSIINQSKNAQAGGPFWIISNEKKELEEKKKELEKKRLIEKKKEEERIKKEDERVQTMLLKEDIAESLNTREQLVIKTDKKPLKTKIQKIDAQKVDPTFENFTLTKSNIDKIKKKEKPKYNIVVFAIDNRSIHIK